MKSSGKYVHEHDAERCRYSGAHVGASVSVQCGLIVRINIETLLMPCIATIATTFQRVSNPLTIFIVSVEERERDEKKKYTFKS